MALSRTEAEGEKARERGQTGGSLEGNSFKEKDRVPRRGRSGYPHPEKKVTGREERGGRPSSKEGERVNLAFLTGLHRCNEPV